MKGAIPGVDGGRKKYVLFGQSEQSGRRRQRKAPDSTNGWVRAVQRFRSNFRSFDGYEVHSDVNALEDEEKKKMGLRRCLLLGRVRDVLQLDAVRVQDAALLFY